MENRVDSKFVLLLQNGGHLSDASTAASPGDIDPKAKWEIQRVVRLDLQEEVTDVRESSHTFQFFFRSNVF